MFYLFVWKGGGDGEGERERMRILAFPPIGSFPRCLQWLVPKARSQEFRLSLSRERELPPDASQVYISRKPDSRAKAEYQTQGIGIPLRG